MRVSFLCVTFVTFANGRGYTSDRWQGRQRARVPPPPHRADRRLGYPRANFFYFSEQIFYFFLPYPIKAPIYPFSFLLRGFLFLCVYFLIRVSFRVSEGKNGENTDCFFLLSCVCVVIMRSILILYSHSLLFFPPVFPLLFCSLCYVFALSFVVDAVFFADLPILLPSVGLSLFFVCNYSSWCFSWL